MPESGYTSASRRKCKALYANKLKQQTYNFFPGKQIGYNWFLIGFI